MKWRRKLLHGYMVYTERAPRQQQFYVAPALQQPNSAVGAPLVWISKQTRHKRPQSIIQNHMQHEHSESLENGEQRYTKAISKDNSHSAICSCFQTVPATPTRVKTAACVSLTHVLQGQLATHASAPCPTRTPYAAQVSGSYSNHRLRERHRPVTLCQTASGP